jgi:hypothetical protein
MRWFGRRALEKDLPAGTSPASYLTWIEASSGIADAEFGVWTWPGVLAGWLVQVMTVAGRAESGKDLSSGDDGI